MSAGVGALGAGAAMRRSELWSGPPGPAPTGSGASGETEAQTSPAVRRGHAIAQRPLVATVWKCSLANPAGFCKGSGPPESRTDLEGPGKGEREA